jgi:hypothetical protein
MKFSIRPIAWTDTNFCTGVGSCCAKEAYWLQVRPTGFTNNPFKWSIRQNTLVLAEGRTDTLEQGQVQCERAWQNFLLENFLETTV